MLQGPSEEEKTALLQWEVGGRVTPTRISAWGLRLRTPASNIVVSDPTSPGLSSSICTMKRFAPPSSGRM